MSNASSAAGGKLGVGGFLDLNEAFFRVLTGGNAGQLSWANSSTAGSSTASRGTVVADDGNTPTAAAAGVQKAVSVGGTKGGKARGSQSSVNGTQATSQGPATSGGVQSQVSTPSSLGSGGTAFPFPDPSGGEADSSQPPEHLKDQLARELQKSVLFHLFSASAGGVGADNGGGDGVASVVGSPVCVDDGGEAHSLAVRCLALRPNPAPTRLIEFSFYFLLFGTGRSCCESSWSGRWQGGRRCTSEPWGHCIY